MPAKTRPQSKPFTRADPRGIPSYTVEVPGRRKIASGDGPPRFQVVFANEHLEKQAFSGDLYGAAMAFVRGDTQVSGDLFAAVRFFMTRARRGWRQAYHTLVARTNPLQLETWRQSRQRATDNLQRHYDRSNGFYRLFLDRRMTYSCAYFRDPEHDIDTAQEAKLNHILRKLDLRPGEKFLDIGCGWGSLVEAAARAGASATGCTLSRAQSELARARLAMFGERATILELDYRDLAGQWDKIASVGMFEHVGRRRLGAYFRRVHSLLAVHGLFLNHGLVQPQTARDGPETLFLRRMVFPGTQLPHLAELLRLAEESGFEVLDLENLRPHYALTCRAWVKRLLRDAATCEQYVGRETHRTWVLFLAACAIQFEQGQMDVYQALLARRSSPLPRRLTRDYIYNGVSAEYTAPR